MLQNILVSIKLRSIAVGGDAVGIVQSIETTDSIDLEKYGFQSAQDLLGITAFVPFGIPGEEVKAQVLEIKQKYVRAEIIEVTKESLDREVPPCRYFKQCGGCELQHIDYRAQVEFKQEMVRGALRSGKLPIDVIDKVPELIRSEAFYYRRRIHLHIDRQGHVGFYRTGTRSVVTISECLLAAHGINDGIKKAIGLGPKVCARINSLYLEEIEGAVLAVFIAPYELNNNEIKQISSAVIEHFDHVIIRAAGKDVFYQGNVAQKLFLNKSRSVFVRIPGGGFSQVNWEINMSLIEGVTDYLRSFGSKTVIDMFSGAGNFSMSLAKDGFRVIAVESDKNLIAMGRETAKEQGLQKNLDFREMSVESFLRSVVKDFNDDVSVIADPPRSGLGKLCSELTFAKQIALISCHLPSFVRDLRSFLDLGYEVQYIELYDMFPQTSYLESVVYLTRIIHEPKH